jgi:hypothetical protein
MILLLDPAGHGKSGCSQPGRVLKHRSPGMRRAQRPEIFVGIYLKKLYIGRKQEAHGMLALHMKQKRRIMVFV